MNIDELQSLQDSLKHGCNRFLDNMVDTSSKCTLLQARLEKDAISRWVHVTRKLHHYLMLPVIPVHRHALASIMLSSHALAVERLHHQEWYRAPVPHEWFLCRLCWVDVEDDVHVLLKCEGRSDLLAL